MIPMDGTCTRCMINRYYETAISLGDGEQAEAFLRDIMKAYLALPKGVDASAMGPEAARLLTEHYHLPPDRFLEEKQASNRFVLERLPQIKNMVETAPDPLYAAVQMAILGNYLDFSALQGQVSFEKLDEMLQKGLEIPVDQEQYRSFCRDLSKAKKLLYLTDNAGEIGFDRVLCEEIEKIYPDMDITVCVRGGPANNDALREDAQLMQIPWRVIDNGINIAATPLDRIGREAMDAIRSADLIIAKGMGNTESMYGCGYPVYYLFLIKCRRIGEVFGVPLMTPMLIKDNGRKANADET